MQAPATKAASLPCRAAALVAPAHQSRTCGGTPSFEWAYMSEAHLYHIQVDDDASFTSPEYDSNVYESQLTPGHGLSPGKYCWRVRAWSPCGWGAYSSAREFDVDAPAVPPSFL